MIEIGNTVGKKIRTIRVGMKLAILISGKFPGKIGGMVNKAFEVIVIHIRFLNIEG